MTLQQLNYFVISIDAGTISKAAEQLSLSQPSLSDQILKLENEMGTHLFIRTNRRLILTEAGSRLEPFARAALQATKRGYEAVQSVRELRGGIASFGTFSSAHHYFLTDLITEFRERHPQVRLRLTGTNSSDVVRMILDGKIEAGLIMMPVSNKNLVVSEPVWSTQIGYISSNPEIMNKRIDIDYLLNANLIFSESSWPNTDPIRRMLNQRAQEIGARFEPVIEVEHQATAFQLASRALGDLIATRPILHHLGYGNQLYWTPLEPPAFEVFAFVQRADTAVSSATREIMQLMKRHLHELQNTYKHIEC